MTPILEPVTREKNSSGIWVLRTNAAWKKYVECIGLYKARLDSAMVSSSNRIISIEEKNWLTNEGFVKESCGTGINADTFMNFIVGRFGFTGENALSERIIHSFPGWCAVGWNRKQYPDSTEQDAIRIKQLLDIDTFNQNENDGVACWLSPLALVIAIEGKHRVDLFRSHKFDMLAKIYQREYPPPNTLELMPVKGTDKIWALRCLDSKYFFKSNKEEFNIDLLPLPELSVPLLNAYGVKTGRTLWGLGKLPLPNSEKKNYLIRPSRSTWRELILEASYV